MSGSSKDFDFRGYNEDIGYCISKARRTPPRPAAPAEARAYLVPSKLKLWTRGDARAEMVRVVQGTLEARKALHRAYVALAALGQETGFGDDAAKAIEQLRRGALGGQ